MQLLCAYCLNLAKNAAFPLCVEWTEYAGSAADGTPVRELKQDHAYGSEDACRMLARRFNGDHPDAVIVLAHGGRIRDPWVVTFLNGTACCAYHAEPETQNGWINARR